MKKILLPITIFALSANFVSCKKKVYGCTDPTADNYSPIATDDLQSCIYDTDEIIISNTVTGVTWQQAGTTYEASLTWAEITSDVINNGAVDAYISDGSGVWMPLPVTIYNYSNVSSTISVQYSVGQVVLIWEDSDLTTPIQPDPVDVKLVIKK